jgi:hypothetical protein
LTLRLGARRLCDLSAINRRLGPHKPRSRLEVSCGASMMMVTLADFVGVAVADDDDPAETLTGDLLSRSW